jgi:toxin CptA
MSSINYASPLRIKIQPSPTLRAVVVALHIGAVVLVFVSAIAWVVQLILASIILGSLLAFLSVNGWIARFIFLEKLLPRVDELVWGENNSWLLICDAGEEQDAELLMSSFVHPYLTVVNLKVFGKPWYCRYRSFVILPDNLDAETFRRLRIRLRWYSTPGQDNSVALK